MTYFDIDGYDVYKKNRSICIGYKGEAIVTRVFFNELASEYVKTLGQGGTWTACCSLDNFNSGASYSINVAYENNKLYWVVDASTLTHHGNGQIQFTYTLGTQVKKSMRIPIKITSSLVVTSSAPTISQETTTTETSSNVYAVKISRIGNSSNYECDKTNDEIFEAVESGKMIFAYMYESDAYYYFPINFCMDYKAIFIFTSFYNGTANLIEFEVRTDDGVQSVNRTACDITGIDRS